MFLQSIRIENCRSVVFADIDFRDVQETTRKWTMLVGENGTGKSTILKAIALLLAGSEALPHLIGNPRTWVRFAADECRISGTLVTKEGEERVITLSFAADQPVREIIARNADGLAAIDRALDHAELNYFVVGYGPYRHITADPKSFHGSASQYGGGLRADSLRTLFDNTATLNPLTSWAMRLEYQQGEGGLSIVREAMDALLPGLHFTGIDRNRGLLMFQTPDGPVDLGGLSDGYQNVAAWIGDLLSRVTDTFAHYRDPLAARGVLLIDEIDAHLHPTWQRNLKSFLDVRLPNLQIIGTTHSALTLQQFEQAEAYVLRRQEGRVNLSQFPASPTMLQLHQLYDLAFRIQSLDSLEVERSKNIIRHARHDGSQSSVLVDDAKGVLSDAKATRTLSDYALGNEVLEGLFARLDRVAEGLRQDTNEKSRRSSSGDDEVSS